MTELFDFAVLDRTGRGPDVRTAFRQSLETGAGAVCRHQHLHGLAVNPGLDQALVRVSGLGDRDRPFATGFQVTADQQGSQAGADGVGAMDLQVGGGNGGGENDGGQGQGGPLEWHTEPWCHWLNPFEDSGL